MIRFCITAFRGGMKGFIYEKISLSDPVFDRICCGVAFCAAQVIYRMGKKYGGFWQTAGNRASRGGEHRRLGGDCLRKWDGVRK